MPTTFPNISIEEAKRQLQRQDRVLASVPRGASRSSARSAAPRRATDPAPLSMVETTVRLKPRERVAHGRRSRAGTRAGRRRWLEAGPPAALARPPARMTWDELDRRDEPDDAVPRLDQRLDHADQDAHRHAHHRRPHAGRRQGLRHRPRRDRDASAWTLERACSRRCRGTRSVLLRAQHRRALPRHRPRPRGARALRPDRGRRAATSSRPRSAATPIDDDRRGAQPLHHQRALPAGPAQRRRARCAACSCRCRAAGSARPATPATGMGGPMGAASARRAGAAGGDGHARRGAAPRRVDGRHAAGARAALGGPGRDGRVRRRRAGGAREARRRRPRGPRRAGRACRSGRSPTSASPAARPWSATRAACSSATSTSTSTRRRGHRRLRRRRRGGRRGVERGGCSCRRATSCKWTGQYELLEQMQERMQIVVPLTLVIILAAPLPALPEPHARC